MPESHSEILESIHAALATVIDPEIRRPITELDMVESVSLDAAGVAHIGVLLTIAGCPLKDKISRDVRAAVMDIDGVNEVQITLGAMNDEQRQALKTKLRGGVAERQIPFAQPDSLTKVFAITSGKGGVGKSSVTANLAAAMAAQGLKVGVVDADIYGFSIPRMLGAANPVTKVDEMLIPSQAHGVKVISIGMFVPNNAPVVWRGPMLHRAVHQFLADVYWGDLDVLLLDLPPGTGDVAISVAQLLPNAEIVVVTTPQIAAAEVAERAGTIGMQTKQKVAGVIENMSYLLGPDGSKMDLFGSGGGQRVSDQLTKILGYPVPLLAQIPIEQELREAGDNGVPIVTGDGASPAAAALRSAAASLAGRGRGLAGRSLGINPV